MQETPDYSSLEITIGENSFNLTQLEAIHKAMTTIDPDSPSTLAVWMDHQRQEEGKASAFDAINWLLSKLVHYEEIDTPDGLTEYELNKLYQDCDVGELISLAWQGDEDAYDQRRLTLEAKLEGAEAMKKLASQ